MKRNLLILVFVSFATLSLGQNFGQAGCIELGGSIGYANQTEVINGTTHLILHTFLLSCHILVISLLMD